MARSRASRKQRTRQHIIADQSVNFVERFVIDEGHTAQRVEKDYGYDLFVSTFDALGYAEPGLVLVQIKSAEHLEASGTEYVFDLDVRDYHLWMLEWMPVVLILFDASRRRGHWLYTQRYFEEDDSRRPRRGTRTVRIRVPHSQRISRRGVRRMRQHKQEVLAREGNRP